MQPASNPLHFGIVVIVNLTLGMITPPVGGVLFVTSVVSGVPMGQDGARGIPMLIAQFVVLRCSPTVPALVHLAARPVRLPR
jgi:TRAP-type C4-dicarboxylate transport system permease large subunit